MSTYYTSKYSGEQIDEAVKKIMDGEMTGDYADRQLSNLDTPQAALANLGAGMRPNIGDNCCFIGGGTAGKLPVNQRGAISGSTSADSYFIDRWQLQSNLGNISYELDTDGLSFTTSQGNQGIRQILGTALETGKTYTSSVFLANGELLTKTFAYGSVDIVDSYEDGGVWSFAIVKANDLFVWFPLIEYSGVNTVKPAYVKLEEGSTQTLAYQDEDGAWQLLPQPESDYATQLAKCQRYFRSFNAWTKFEADYIDANRVFFSIPGDMRIDPTVTGEWGVYTGFTLQTGFALEAHRTGSDLVVVASKESHGLTTAWLGVKDNSFGYLNADL